MPPPTHQYPLHILSPLVLSDEEPLSSPDTNAASPLASRDITAAVRLLDASVYDPGGYPQPPTDGLLRPFVSLKSSIYAGTFDDGGVPRAVAVKFWRCPDRHVENQVWGGGRKGGVWKDE